MTTHFTWIPIYEELARELTHWQDRQEKLIAFLNKLHDEKFTVTLLMDKDEDGVNFLLKEIDPFTFFGVFNRGIRKEQRIALLSEISSFFKLKSALPKDFDGVPVLHNMSSWFFGYQKSRGIGDIEKLWHVFKLALEKEPLNQTAFLDAFDDALTVRQTNINLTMGLFWICPKTFLSLDQNIRGYLSINLPPSGLSSKFYHDTVVAAAPSGKSFPELSYEAWLANKKPKPEKVDYWLVGAYYDGNDPPDQTQRFLAESIWENGYIDRFINEVKSMKVGDKIAIKASGTQRLGLPFDSRNKTVSRNTIKAIGTIVANRSDGRTIEVEWDPRFKEKNWYFYTNRVTVWHIHKDEKYKWIEAANKLIDFVWNGKEQDYDWFIKNWWGTDKERPYSIEDMLAQGVFLSSEDIQLIIDRLRDKKAIILQGPPGVGKTFIVEKLAFAFMEEIDHERLCFIQFHQSYSYDDFIRGYRPNLESSGAFVLQNGIFYEFCQKAINDPEQDYIFIIDEINRGNISQIFGEMLMLIENDKRGKEFSVPLVYRKEKEPNFYIPSNLYMIGLMNLADRSLAIVDYALRRRFAFYSVETQFEKENYQLWLSNRGMKDELIQLIINRLSALNKIIRDDPLLGENYQIGHSYFCPRGDDFSELDKKWYQNIVKTEIIPLLKEYWFDNLIRANDAEKSLLAP